MLIVEKPANPSFITGKTGTVLNVFTKSQYRKHAIAGKLMKVMLDDAKDMNLSYVELQATDFGKPIYENIGFDIVKSKYTHMKCNLQ